MIPILIARFWEQVTGRTKIAQVQKQKLPTDQDRIGWFTGKFAGPTMTQWGKVLSPCKRWIRLGFGILHVHFFDI